MPQRPTELRPWESPEALFGSEMRYYREAAALSCVQLSNKIPFSKSTISTVERAEMRCDRSLAVEADRVLDTHGALTRLWDGLFKKSGAIPQWFTDWYDREPDATNIRTFQPLVVPGLLQTPDYARAFFDDNEIAVETRIGRQDILTREDPPPPYFLCLLDESVLYRDVGGPDVMRAQLEHLIAMSSPRVKVQILPSIQHGGLSGAFVIGTLSDGSEVAYREGMLHGDTTTDREKIRRLGEAFSQIQSHAYPLTQSIELIKRVAKERWT